MRPTAIVTDGLWRKSLSAVRALGKAGFDVTVMGDSLFTTAFWSRFASDRVKAPTAVRDSSAFGEALLATAKRTPGAVLFPMEDPSLMWISQNREELARYAKFLIPSQDALAIAQNKGETLRVAEALGLPCPRTARPSSILEFEKHIGTFESFVVKPVSGTGSSGVAYSGAIRDWQEHWRKFGALLIQDRIPAEGRGQGVSLLMDQAGECVASFAHERLQQYPNSGGPSTDRWGIHAPELVEKSVKLLKHLKWRGIAMVEWKVDPRDGVAKLMEINPRFWGSLELAVRSGVNFPVLYAKASAGEKLAPPPSYEKGVRCRWMMPGDILRYISSAAREPLPQFLSGLPGQAEEWDASDMRGALSTFLCTSALALNPRYWRYVLRG